MELGRAVSGWFAPRAGQGDAGFFGCVVELEPPMYGGKISVAQAELQAHKLQCTRELRELHEALRVTLSDSEVMDPYHTKFGCSAGPFLKNTTSLSHGCWSPSLAGHGGASFRFE